MSIRYCVYNKIIVHFTKKIENIVDKYVQLNTNNKNTCTFKKILIYIKINKKK